MKEKEKVFIYFNLHKKVFSVRSMKSGLVIAHVSNIEISDAVFKVSEKGRQRVIEEKRKNIHAGVVGFISKDEQTIQKLGSKIKKAKYNPYKYSTFVDDESEERLEHARYVRLSVNNQIPKIEYI